MENAVERKRIELQKLLAPAALVILYVFFSLFGRNFFGYEGLKQIFQSSYYIGFMAFGVTFVIITGGIDLSIGTVMMCSALIGGVAFTVWGWPVWLALLLVPVVGLCFGLLNGVMIAKAKLPPFIATLGVMLISQGFGSILSNVRTMHYSPAYVGDWFRSVFYLYHNIPIGAIWLLGAFAVAFLLLSRTRLGRYTFAIGSNEEAARLSGVKVDAWKIGIYAICGLFSGLAGLFFGGAYTTITPGTGNGEELNAIARGGHRRHVDVRRQRHHGRHPDWRSDYVHAEKGAGVRGPPGALADLLYRFCGHRRGAAGPDAQPRGDDAPGFAAKRSPRGASALPGAADVGRGAGHAGAGRPGPAEHAQHHGVRPLLHGIQRRSAGGRSCAAGRGNRPGPPGARRCRRPRGFSRAGDMRRAFEDFERMALEIKQLGGTIL